MYAVSSPAVVLAAIAQATSRIRLTTTATDQVLVPSLHPGDVVVVDNLEVHKQR